MDTSGVVTKYCCDWKNDQCSCSKKIENPCSDPANCLTCMVYGEAGSTAVDNKCNKKIACTIKNRAVDDDYLDSICDVVSQGDGKQFNPYYCVCSSGDGDANAGSNGGNQKYCDCCDFLESGTNCPVEGSDERKELDAAQTAFNEALSANGCSDFKGDSFFTPTSGGAQKCSDLGSGCRAVPEKQQKGCSKSQFTFCICSG